ncbi:putative peptidase [Sphaerospermopsis kisseleviana NIES-73]|nr:putative peptidase [Sphaerospermopsis kisseleviana NIES-73]
MAESTKSVVFIDPNVADYQNIVNSVKPGTLLFLLDGNRDGIQQITQNLSGLRDIDSLQIISQGAEGSLSLGSTVLNSANLSSYTSQLQQWGQSLTATGDILLYGSNVAQGLAGKTFVQQISQLTGADVAASDDLTGNTASGGDWVLEYTTGLIEASPALEIAPIISNGNSQDTVGKYTPNPPAYASNKLIVKFKDGINTTQANEIKNTLGVAKTETIKLTGAQIWTLSGKTSVETALATHKNNPIFQYIEPDYIVTKAVTFPNDPSFNQLWGLHNTGQSGGTPDADIDAPEAWDIQTGNPNLVIGVLDTGVDYNHPDLVGNIWTNPGEIANDGIDNDNNGYIDDIRGWDFAYNDNNPSDVDGHGTHVSGTIAGKGNNGVGVTGVAWNAKIMPLKFLDDTGSGSTSNAILAINYATAKGVKITNNSWGGGGYSQALYDAINTAGQQGALFIAAAGNSSANADINPMYPAAYNLANIISVASTTNTDSLSSFSNYGLTSVDLGAPGSAIYSTLPNNSYGTLSGTSMASPHVAGAAALVWSQNPTWTAQQVKNTLMNTGDSIAALAGKTVSGKRLNVFNALAAANLPSVTVSVSPATVQEDGATNLVYTFTRTNLNLSSPLTVNFGASGIANAAPVGSDPADYNVLTGSAVTFNPTTKLGTVTFAANATTATVVVDPIADTLAEIQNETVNITVNSGTGYIGGSPGAATGTIVSEETLPIFTNPNNITIPSSGAGNPYPSIINVSGLTGNITSLKVTLTNLSHTWSDDIDVLLVSPTGAKAILMSDVGGSNDLANVTLTFDPTATANLPDSSQITSGSYKPTNFQSGDLFNSPAPVGPYGTDFSVFNNTNPNGNWSLYVMDDEGSDSGSIAGGWSLLIGTSTTPTLPVITVVANDSSAGEPANPGQYTLTRTGLTTSSLTVNVALTGTATNGTDYTTIPTTVTFAAGSSTALVNLNVTDDTLVEGAETAILTVTSGTGYTVGTSASATVNIADNDSLPTITVVATDANAAETLLGTTPNPGQFTLTRTGPITSSLTVNVSLTGTATNGTDYTTIPTTVTFAAGSSTALVNLNVTDDTLVEGAETAILTVTSGTGYTVGTSASATVNIADNDLPTITVVATDANAAETLLGTTPNPGQFTLTRTGPTTSSLTVNVALTGTATNGTDYTTIPTTVTFAAGSSTALVNLNVTDDTLVEGAETAILTVTSGTGYTVGTSASATVNIADNDLPSINLSANQTVVEGNTSPQNVTYTVTLSSASTETVTVQYATVGNTAIAGSDYTTTSGTLTFAPGVTSQVINIPILNDDLNEADETFTLTLSSPTNANLGTTTTVTTTITDTLTADVTTTLPAGVENLTLTGTAAINGTGNAGNNVLTGNSANNSLTGGAGNDTLNGGAGIDALIGGLGDDAYIVDSNTDIITENANEGTDTIQSSVTFSISAITNIENLTLTGTAAINGTGNAGNNVLTGNSANNTLNAGAGNDTLDGGAGIDALIGGLGNDVYIVDSATDIITENAGGGTDTIQSSVTFNIVTRTNIENLTLTGAAAINGTGNAGNNVLIGNSANNILNGGAGNDTLDGGAGIDTLIGGLGNDVYSVDSTTDIITENAGGGTDTIQSSVTFSIATLTNIENLTLTGTDAINGTGNAGNNVITGNSANNSLDGAAGIDTLIGGDGNDTYYVDNTGDTITENANQGTDTVYSTTNYTLSANIEDLTLTGSDAINGTGNAGNNVITGSSADNTLDGASGNDTLNGGAGIDTLIGGLGDDAYIVDTTTDTITENANEGTDTISTSVTYSLAALANVENLTLGGTEAINGTGNAANNVLTGNAADNTLDGASGNDTLDGGGGIDILIGGLGNDTYYVDTTDDTITENANEGTDTVYTTTDYALLENLENLTLTGTAANGTGNDGNNVITGNELDNILDGGAGIDTLIGGDGNDTYYVDDSSDIITENANEGTDTVYSTTNYTLSANIENLTLTGTAAINGTGNAGNNVITGNELDNILDGGAGIDTLIGGDGNDTYYVDNSSDIITENANEGTDTVYSTTNYTLSANIENLTLTGTAANGTGNAGNNTLTGNTGNNILTGNTGNNILVGGDGNDLLTGGTGKDTLTGGVGVDRFDYRNLADSVFNNNSFDVITDFNATADRFVVTTARSAFNNVGSVATLDAAGIAALLNTITFTANSAAQFSFGSRTFVAINNATAGFSATADAIVELTDFTGTLGLNNFTTTLV